MQTTIDRAGRIVVPKALRDALALREGTVLRLRLEDGRIVIEPEPVAKEVAGSPHGPVLRPVEPVPVLTVDEVRAALDEGRR
jgi:AbrB family looped-hinge helix DNA binding protein